MAALKSLLSLVGRRRWLVAILSVLAALTLLLAFTRLWITSNSGRGFIESQIDGRKAGPLGIIQIEGLTGDPLDRLGAKRITLADPEGVWLSVEDVDLIWSPARLMSRTVKLDFVSAGKVDLRRRPILERNDSPDGGSSGNWAVSLDEVEIAEFLLQEGVAGPRAAFSIDGKFRLPKARTVDLSLTALPLEGAGDRIEATLKRAVSGAYRLDADIEAPSGGTLASLARLPDGESASLSARASGTLKEGDGFAELKISGATIAELTGKITAGDLLASANLNASRIPLSEQVRSLIGPSASLTLEGDVRKRQIPFNLSGKLASGAFSANGVFRSKARKFEGPVNLDLTFRALEDLTGVAADLAFSGQVNRPMEAPELAGTARLSARPDSDLPFDAIEGPISITPEQSLIKFNASLAGTGLLKSNATANRVMGKAPKLDLSGSYNRTNGTLTLASSKAQLAEGSATANGTADLKAKTLNLTTGFRNLSGLLSSAPGLSASGTATLRGGFSSPLVEADITATRLDELGTLAEDIMGQSARLRGIVQRTEGTYRIRSASLQGDKLGLTLSGTYAGSGPVALNGKFEQRGPVEISGTAVNLSSGMFRLSGASGVDTLSFSSSNGTLQRDPVDITSLQVTAALEKASEGWAGPVSLAGYAGEEPVRITSLAAWSDGLFELRDIQSDYETAALSGSLLYGARQGLDLNLRIAGDRFTLGARHIGAFDVALNVDRLPDAEMSIAASGRIEDLWLSPSLRFDALDGQVRNAPEGYNFAVHVQREHELRPTSLNILGAADFAADYPSGQIELDGTLLGEQVRSVQPVSWRLGDTPSIEASLAIFGGSIEARIAEQTRSPILTLAIQGVDLAPVLASAGISTQHVMVDGSGQFALFGADPAGQFDLTMEGPLPGLELPLAIDMTGHLRQGALRIEGAGDYGELRLAASATLPVQAEPEGIAHLDFTRPIQGQADLTGDLSDLRSLALAYGHDVGGTIDASATLSGSLGKPVVAAKAKLVDGTYEFGATSLRLVNLTLDAAYENQALVLTSTGQGVEGGTARVSGRLAADATDLSTDFSELLVYDRDGDSLRASGKIRIAGEAAQRAVTGNVTVQSARFNLDNLPSSRARAIDVRWKEDGEQANSESALRQSLRLNIDISADRRVYIDGRGLESEWGADLVLTGTAANPLLNGRATMRRGTLDLAGRPFVFDTGTVYFDGPLTRARLDVEAERSVNGFDATVALTGSPTKPDISLSSSPDLPEDEILSRLLFGRSSVDLSAFETAQLANSIARLSGSGSGFNPGSQLQAALGVDRLSFGTTEEGAAQVGVGQYIADDVYLELNSAGAAGSSVEVEWEPRPQVSVTSETTTDGEAKLSIKWKKDY